MRRDDERRARGERGGEAGGDEEVRVDDVRVEASGSCADVRGEPRVLRLAPAAVVDHGALELVPAVAECRLELLDEDAEIRVVRPGIHLRDEQDAHTRSFARAAPSFPIPIIPGDPSRR